MTREEAIHILDNLKPTNTKSLYDAYDVGKAITMAIKALEQEPCEDAISRQAVLDELKKWDWQELYLPIHFKENIIDVVPSVNQQEPKTGHWIYSKDINTGEIRWSECSVCGNGESGCAKRMKYCPECGARMEDK